MKNYHLSKHHLKIYEKTLIENFLVLLVFHLIADLQEKNVIFFVLLVEFLCLKFFRFFDFSFTYRSFINNIVKFKHFLRREGGNIETSSMYVCLLAHNS